MTGKIYKTGRNKIPELIDEDPLGDLRWRGPQFIYFIWAHGTGAIKIGQSEDPESRLSELATGNPNQLELLITIPVSGEIKEIRLHRAFSHLKINREWFYAEDDLLDFIVHTRDRNNPVEYLEALEKRRGLYGDKHWRKHMKMMFGIKKRKRGARFGL